MKSSHTPSKKLFGGLVAALLLTAPLLKADTFSYDATIDTPSLALDTHPPVSLSFTLYPGSTDAINTVTISNLTYTGGTNSLNGTFSLVDGGDTSYTENLSLSTTQISFEVTTTQNYSGPGAPNVLVIHEQDNNGSLSNAIDLAITTANTLSDVSIIGATDDLTVSLPPEDAPEPSTWALLLGGLGLLAFWHRRTRRAQI